MEIIPERNTQFHNLQDQNDEFSQTFTVQDSKSSSFSPQSTSSSKSVTNESLPTEMNQDKQKKFVHDQSISAKKVIL